MPLLEMCLTGISALQILERYLLFNAINFDGVKRFGFGFFGFLGVIFGFITLIDFVIVLDFGRIQIFAIIVVGIGLNRGVSSPCPS